MTEQEWLTGTDLLKLLVFLRGRASERKLRLFACTCCREVIPFFQGKTDFLGKKYLDAVSAAEHLADRQITEEEVGRVRRRWNRIDEDSLPERQDYQVRMIRGALGQDAFRGANYSLFWATDVDVSPLGSLYCVFGNPFRPVRSDPAWLAWHDRTIPQLAGAIYEDRDLPSGHLDNTRLAVLADALEDAGCDNQDILGHCRSGGEHVRGCWVVDLLLGKT
jgi:hypothetical protein